MEDTIKSGDTERVISELLNNNFGERLMMLHHSRQSSLVNTQQLNDIDINENSLPLPQELSDHIQINNDFLVSVQNPNSFAVYKVCHDFQAVDERHMTIKKDVIFVGLQVVETNWVFGCPDINPNSFGFVPINYLQFMKEIHK